MDGKVDMIFKEQNQDKNGKEKDDFAASCKPLSELLDSVRNIEGFPIGTDEDILALSDPPYYTACPNPYINDFIEKYGKPYDEATDTYERTPYVGDVSEGKDDPIYNAHSYHTKVPHQAIMKFVEHYTNQGDIIFDGFSGSGMAGVASQFTERYAILCDLSPAATFIAYNYNKPISVREFEKEAKDILDLLTKECGWLYETLHADGKTKGRINYTVWSDVLTCPYCINEYIFWEAALGKDNKIKERYECPHCKALIKKSESARAENRVKDDSVGKNITTSKRVPVFIQYTVGKKRFVKAPDKVDLQLLKKIEESSIPYWFPTNQMMDRGGKWGDTWRAGYHFGITNVHHFYTKRNLWLLAAFNSKIARFKPLFLSALLGLCARASLRNRYMPEYGNRHVGTLSGTLYVPTLSEENNLLDSIRFRLNKLIKSLKSYTQFNNIGSFISTNSLTDMSLIKDNCVDYIFTDPPFGDNLMYSELNFNWESWLKVWTNNNKEAIINNSQNKDLSEYKDLMMRCFSECYRILKPNHWITVEFHNSKASIWNAIQDALAKAGFIIAQVAVIDKQKGTTKQLTYAGTVKNDLVINAYKPKKRFEEYFLKRAGEGLEKEFVEEHLNHLPPEPNIERTEQMLFSKMLAHYVKHGFEIRLNAKQFYMMLRDNFKLIEGYWFTDKQLHKYEEWKKQGLGKIKEIKSGYEVLFINDEKSALIWLYNFLDLPRTYSDIYTAYSKATSNIEDKIPELKDLLGSNFISEDKAYRRPKTDKEQEAVEEQREKDLNKAFEQILLEAKTGGKKLKEIRKEAVTFGLTKAYQERRFEDILTVAKKLDRKILEENSEINDFVEIAQLKVGAEI